MTPESPSVASADESHVYELPRSGWAIASLALGIVAVALVVTSGWGFILGLIGIFLGDAGLREVHRGEASGESMAKAGRVLGVVAMALAIVRVVIIASS